MCKLPLTLSYERCVYMEAHFVRNIFCQNATESMIYINLQIATESIIYNMCLHICVYIYMYIYVYIYSCTYVTQGVVPSSYIDLALQPDAFCHTPVWVICAFRIFKYEVFKCTLIITCTLPFQKFCTTTLMHLHKNLRHTATHCNTLQHTATHCNTLCAYTDSVASLCAWQYAGHLDFSGFFFFYESCAPQHNCNILSEYTDCIATQHTICCPPQALSQCVAVCCSCNTLYVALHKRYPRWTFSHTINMRRMCIRNDNHRIFWYYIDVYCNILQHYSMCCNILQMAWCCTIILHKAIF